VSSAHEEAQGTARPRGRPRSAASHEAILQATLELIGEKGFRGTSMDAVAERAGVSKATIYRRWKSKEELVGALLDALADVVRIVDSGDPFDDLVETSRYAAEHGEPVSRLITALQGEAAANPEFDVLFREKLLERRREQMREFIRNAIDAGHIREDIDVDFLADVMFGTVVMRANILGGTLKHLVEDQIALWDMLIDGVGTPKGKRALTRRRGGLGKAG
jgi:AcrR family transcriptional regulator